MQTTMIKLTRRLLIFLGIISRPQLLVCLVNEHPMDDEIKDGFVYVVGGRDFQKWAYFRCPEDQTEIIQLSLMQKHRPCWRVKWDLLGRPTIYPSVRQTVGSFAHFWVRRGVIELCADSGVSLSDKPEQFYRR